MAASFLPSAFPPRTSLIPFLVAMLASFRADPSSLNFWMISATFFMAMRGSGLIRDWSSREGVTFLWFPASTMVFLP